MSSFKRRCRQSKKAASTNPYASRGLDKFALVSAELESKREKLAAQLDTPLSMVKFALGSHNKWIPIILSRSTKKEGNAPKRKSAPEDKIALGGRSQKSGLRREGKSYVGGFFNKQKAHLSGGSESGPRVAGTEAHVGKTGFASTQKTHLSGFISEDTTHLGDFISEGETTLTPLDGLNAEEGSYTESFFNEDTSHYTDKTTMAGLLDIERPPELGEIIEILSASSDVEHIAAYEGSANALQGQNSKTLMWAVSMASTIATNAIFLRWHTKAMVKHTAPAGKPPLLEEEKSVDESMAPSIPLSSPSPLGNASASSPLQTQLLPSLPSPLAQVKIVMSKSLPSDQDAIAKTEEDMSTLQIEVSKQHRKCKVKGFLKMRSAPSTPRDSRQPKNSFNASSALPKTHGLSDQAVHTGAKEERLVVVHKAANPQKAPTKSRFSRASAIEKAEKETARRVGRALAITGLVLSLSGLLMGYVSAIVGVVCWWYVMPGLRKAVGDKPVVRSHHRSHENRNNYGNDKTMNAHTKSNKVIREVGSGKYDLHSHEYKKKVIMEGLLDRGRRPNG